MKPCLRWILLIFGLAFLVGTVVLIVRNLDIVFWFLFYCIISAAVGTAIYFGLKDTTAKRYTTPIIIGVVAIVMYFGCRSINFHVKIHLLEREFISAANHEPRWIEWESSYGKLNYDGRLDEILQKRDQLLVDYHYRMVGSWWVTTDSDPDASPDYCWSPFGLF